MTLLSRVGIGVLFAALCLVTFALFVVRANVFHAVVSEDVTAPADRVRALYEDSRTWARHFPATIRGARVVRKEGATTVIEVDHVEGIVMNILRDVSSTQIDLTEFKRRYDATFVNEFIPDGTGMRYRLTASVHLKWPYRLPAPFLQPLTLARVARYVVEPLKTAAEREPSQPATLGSDVN